MKIKYLKSMTQEKKQRVGGAMLLVCLTLLAITPNAAQLRIQTRVTALQLGEASEGSRVTVVSDSPLNAYEAFRRGNRFYVKIPLADFIAAVPHFRADGFEDVQVQSVGGGLIVSFKLQPGATARVDQHSNRLDVIFAAPNVMARQNSQNPSPGTAGRNWLEHANRFPGRELDTTDPVAQGTSEATREAVDGETASDRANIYRASDWRKRTNNRVAISSGTPQQATPTPTVNNDVGASGPPAAGSGTPSSLASTNPSGSPSPSTLGSSTNGKTRINALRQWFYASRLTTAISALVLLNLILFLVLFFYRRRKHAGRVKRATAPLA